MTGDGTDPKPGAGTPAEAGVDRSARQRRRSGKPGGRLARSAARLAAVQALYQMEVTGSGWQQVREEFERHRLGSDIEGLRYADPDIALFRGVLEGVHRRQVRIDHLTDDALNARWPLGRIDATLRALFRAAGYELVEAPETPAKVVIGEYVDIAKAFFPNGREPGFVNGVLDHMARDARPGALDG
ncbi:MAG: transcription antitermination factor NusB [Pseudomonadota bacterium]